MLGITHTEKATNSRAEQSLKAQEQMEYESERIEKTTTTDEERELGPQNRKINHVFVSPCSPSRE
jgi:hypothetical protein